MYFWKMHFWARPPGKRGGAPARTARADLADSHISSSNPRATNKLAMKRPLNAENSGARSVATSYSACAGLDDGSGFVHHGPLFAYFKGSTFSTAVWQNNWQYHIIFTILLKYCSPETWHAQIQRIECTFFEIRSEAHKSQWIWYLILQIFRPLFVHFSKFCTTRKRGWDVPKPWVSADYRVAESPAELLAA